MNMAGVLQGNEDAFYRNTAMDMDALKQRNNPLSRIINEVLVMLGFRMQCPDCNNELVETGYRGYLKCLHCKWGMDKSILDGD